MQNTRLNSIAINKKMNYLSIDSIESFLHNFPTPYRSVAVNIRHITWNMNHLNANKFSLKSNPFMNQARIVP